MQLCGFRFEVARRSAVLRGDTRKSYRAVAQLSIAWLLHRSPVMLPIPGTSSVEHLEENVKAAGVKLDAKTMKELG